VQGTAAKDRIARLERELLRQRQMSFSFSRTIFSLSLSLSLSLFVFSFFLFFFLSFFGANDGSEYEREISFNPSFRDRIKAIERLALRYAPLEGAEAEHLFDEIEWAKDVLDGATPPPKPPKSKRKKKA